MGVNLEERGQLSRGDDAVCNLPAAGALGTPGGLESPRAGRHRQGQASGYTGVWVLVCIPGPLVWQQHGDQDGRTQPACAERSKVTKTTSSNGGQEDWSGVDMLNYIQRWCEKPGWQVEEDHQGGP